MKTKWILLLMLLLGHQLLEAQQFPRHLRTAAVLSLCEQQIGVKRDSAVKARDYFAEAQATKAGMLLADFKAVMGKKAKKKFRKIGYEKQQFVFTITDLLSSSPGNRGKIRSLSDFMRLGIEPIAGRFSFQDQMMLTDWKGCSLIFTGTGSYVLHFKGKGFEAGVIQRIKIDGREVPASNFSAAQPGILQVNIPSGWLREKFDERTVQRIAIEVICFAQKQRKYLPHRKEKQVFAWKDSLLLLPLKPVTYQLAESLTDTLREERWTLWAEDTIAATEPQVLKKTGEISLHLTEGNQIVKYERRVIPDNNRVRWEAVSYSEDRKTLTLKASHSFRSVPTRIGARACYVVAVPVVQQRLIVQDTAMPFGFQTAALSHNFQVFQLQVSYFNGEKCQLSSEHAEAPGIKTILQGEKDKKLVIEFWLPEIR